MPLKELDLKTFEAYKKAVRNDVSKITATSKTKFWVYKDIELLDVKGKKQKIPAFIALVEDSGVRNFLRSKKLLCLGTCRLETGKVCFEPKKGKVPFQQLKVSVPLFLGKPIYIPTNAPMVDEGEEIENDDDDTETDTGDTQSNDNGLAAAWTKLQAEVQESLSKVPARREAVSKAAAGIADLIKAGDVKGATEKMAAVRAVLNSPPPTPVQASGLAAAWDKLARQAQAAIANDPARKSAISQAAAGISDLVKANNVAEATKRMAALELVLNSGSEGGTGKLDAASLKAAWTALVPKIRASGDAVLNQAAGDAGKKLGDLVNQGKLAEAQAIVDDLTARFSKLKPPETQKFAAADVTTAWQKLVPEIEKKVKFHPDVKDAVLRARKQIDDLIKAGKFEAAKQAVDDVAALLAKTSEGPVEQPVEQEKTTPEDPRKAEYESKRKLMDRDIERALQEKIGDVSRIRAAVALAGERAEGRDYVSALKVLAGLDELLNADTEEDDDMPVAGLMEYRKKLAAFDTACHRAEDQIDALVAAIPNTVPEEAELADELKEEFDEQIEEIRELIDEAVNAANDDKAPVDKALKGQIHKTLEEFASSKLHAHMEKNPFGVTFDIRKTLTASLNEIINAIPVAV